MELVWTYEEDSLNPHLPLHSEESISEDETEIYNIKKRENKMANPNSINFDIDVTTNDEAITDTELSDALSQMGHVHQFALNYEGKICKCLGCDATLPIGYNPEMLLKDFIADLEAAGYELVQVDLATLEEGDVLPDVCTPTDMGVLPKH